MDLLRDALRSRDERLFSETEYLVKRVMPLLWRTIATFPSGTSHTPDHTTCVERIASMILPEELLQQLTNDELSLLILACHFHDLGMAGTEFDNHDRITRNQARQDHAIRIGSRIKEQWRELGFHDHIIPELLAELCRGHRPARVNGQASWSDLRPIGFIGVNRKVRIQLLSALIYAADELHIGADRAPILEEQWLELNDDDARRHWRRHQCVVGPVLDRETIAFEVRVCTLALEADLRSHVFRKAFGAIRDTNAQLLREGLSCTLRRPTIVWLREDLWKLAILATQCDGVLRDDSELSRAVCDRFVEQSRAHDSLSDVIVAHSAAREDLERQIHRVISDWKLEGKLLHSRRDSSLQLSSDARTAEYFFKLARSADDIDVLFAGRYATRHEYSLLSSDYGRRFRDSCLTPRVTSGFGVNLAVEPDESAVLAAIHNSATATRLLMDFAPPPGILVMRHLLRLASLTGASLDLMRSPELILRHDFRHAVRDLARMVARGHDEFFRFIEELVLVGGYSFEQVHEAMVHSEAEERESRADDEASFGTAEKPTVTVRFSQSIPESLPLTAVSMPHLILAGIRSGVEVELLNTQEAPIHASTESNVREEQPIAPLAKIGVGPGKPSFSGNVEFRAGIVVDPTSRTVEWQICALSEQESRSLPVIVTLPRAALIGGGTATSRFDFYWPALSAQELRSLSFIKDFPSEGLVECRLKQIKDGKLLGKQKLGRQDAERIIPRVFGSGVVEFLAALADPTPLPWWCPKAELAVLESGADPEKREIYEKYRRLGMDGKPEVTAVVLRIANRDGMDFREEFLGMFPDVHFRAPEIVESDSLKQDEFNRSWKESDQEITLAASYSSDVYELAENIRDWARDPTQKFPLNVSSTAPESPIFKTQFELVNCPRVDRLWFVERPIILRLRPIQSTEQWRVEAQYWEAVGDMERRQLLLERLESLNEPQAKETSGSP